MKKLLAIILILLLFIPETVAFAANIDVSSMSDQELSSLIDQCRTELSSRKQNSGDKLTIVNENGIEIYLTNHFTAYENYDGKHYIDLDAAVVNGSNSPIYLYDKGCCINGWKVGTTFTFGDIPAGKSKKIEITLCLNDADITTFDEVKDIYFAIEAVDPNNYSNKIDFVPYTLAK